MNAKTIKALNDLVDDWFNRSAAHKDDMLRCDPIQFPRMHSRYEAFASAYTVCAENLKSLLPKRKAKTK